MKKSLLFAASLLAVICSCEKPSPEPGGETTVDKVSVSPKNHTFIAAGEAVEVSVESSGEWTLDAADRQWVKADVTKGKNGDKVTFTATANTETSKRGPVTFTFTSGKAKAVFTADQAAAETGGENPGQDVQFELEDPSKANLQFEADGGNAMLNLKTALSKNDITMTLSAGADWITAQLADAQPPILGMVIAKNTGAERTATVTLSAANAKDIVITISQKAGESQPSEKVSSVDFTAACLYSNWPKPEPFTDMSKFTAEMLVNASTFSKGSDTDANINTLLGIEGTFLVRVWDANGNGNIEVMYNKGTESSIKDVAYLETGKWYHIATTFDNGTIQLYVNGELKDTKELDNGVKTLTLATGEWVEETNWGSKRNFYLGFSCDHRRCLKGNMSEVRIWNKVLSESEINAAGHFYSVDPKSDGLIAYWKLNEGSGDVAKDSTSNGNDLYGHTGITGSGGGSNQTTDGINWVEVDEIKVN